MTAGPLMGSKPDGNNKTLYLLLLILSPILELSPCYALRWIGILAVLLCISGCGYQFTGGVTDNPFPEDVKTIMISSVSNNTTIRGLETELTNQLRSEFGLGTRLRPVRSDGDATLSTDILSYEETVSAFNAAGKEITRKGTLTIQCALKNSKSGKALWQRNFSATSTYNVASSITDTLTNQRQALSRIIKEIVPDVHRSMYQRF